MGSTNPAAINPLSVSPTSSGAIRVESKISTPSIDSLKPIALTIVASRPDSLMSFTRRIPSSNYAVKSRGRDRPARKNRSSESLNVIRIHQSPAERAQFGISDAFVGIGSCCPNALRWGEWNSQLRRKPSQDFGSEHWQIIHRIKNSWRRDRLVFCQKKNRRCRVVAMDLIYEAIRNRWQRSLVDYAAKQK